MRLGPSRLIYRQISMETPCTAPGAERFRIHPRTGIGNRSTNAKDRDIPNGRAVPIVIASARRQSTPSMWDQLRVVFLTRALKHGALLRTEVFRMSMEPTLSLREAQRLLSYWFRHLRVALRAGKAR
jgi:hypothetical protein